VGNAAHMLQNGEYTGEGTLCGISLLRERTLWVMRRGVNQCYDWYMGMRSVVQAE